MGRQVGVGFVLSTKTADAEAGFRGFSHTVAESMTRVNEAFGITEHAAELLSRAWDFLKEGISETIGVALSFRTANDGVLGTLERFQRSIEVVKARIGDSFLPILLSLAEAFSPIVEAMTKWLTVNNRWLSQNIGGAVLEIAGAIGHVLIPAVGAVGDSLYGWKMIINVVAGVFDQFVGNLAADMRELAKGWAEIFDKIGQTEISDKLFEISGQFQFMSLQWHKSAKQHSDDIQTNIDDLDAWDSRVKKWGSSFDAAMRLADEALKRNIDIGVGGDEKLSESQANRLLMAQAIKDAEMNENTLKPKIQDYEELQAAGAKARDVLHGIVDAERQLASVIAGATDSERARYEVALTILQDKARVLRKDIQTAGAEEAKLIHQQIALYDKYGQAVGDVMGKLAAGTITAGNAMKEMTLVVWRAIRDAAMHQIEAYAATAAAGAASSQAGLGPYGPYLAVAAAAAMFAAVEAYMQTFHTGGFVKGGENVPIMAQGGEYVMSRGEVAAGKPRWGSGGGDGAPTQIAVSMTQQNLVPLSDADFARKTKVIVRMIQGALNDGSLRIPGAT